MTFNTKTTVSSPAALSGSVKRLFSIAIAFVAPVVLSIPVHGQEAADKPPAGFNRPLPPSSGVEINRRETIELSGPGRGPDFALLPPGPRFDASADVAGVDMGARFLKGDVAVTDAQYEKLHQLHSDFMDRFAPKMVELMTQRRHLKDALTSEVIDMSRVNDIRSKLYAAGKDMADMKIDNEIAVMNVYTSEQRKHLHLAMLKCPGLAGGMGEMGGWGHHMGGMRGHEMGRDMHDRHNGMSGGKECSDGGMRKHGGWQPKDGDAGSERSSDHEIRHGGWHPRGDEGTK